MSDLTPPPGPGGSGLPARRITSTELEAVIRRAVELQSGAEGDDGLAEGEVIRIGQELGLAPELVRRAIADVRGKPVEEKGLAAGVVGPSLARAVRSIRRPAAPLGMFLEQYLVDCEFMVVQRRFPDRTRYGRGTGVGAHLGRASRKMQSRYGNLDLRTMDVGVSVIDDSTSLVELSVDLSAPRAMAAGGGLSMGTVGGAGVAAIVFGAHLAAPLMLLGLPVIGAGVLVSRLIHHSVHRRTQDQLESFLDRLEHGELKLEKPLGGFADLRKKLGF
ncbi:MAG: hypothetical protein JWM27_1107 [Gemmatimonadetes bacterium]|nr:hypothetical protein [Gemmatimonadota bacterium]